MRQLFISLCGHNAAGKTTIAKQLEKDLGISRVNADDFRLFVASTVKYFNDLDISIKNSRFEELANLSNRYRLDMTKLLLELGQSVIYEGGSTLRSWRKTYLSTAKNVAPSAVRILIYVDIEEAELLKRLDKRGLSWTKQYHTSKRSMFEIPTPDEADLLLTYNQANYKELLQQIQNQLNIDN